LLDEIPEASSILLFSKAPKSILFENSIVKKVNMKRTNNLN